jgi:hypothetical protein
MDKEYEIGDSAYLKVPQRGYSYVEVVGFHGVMLIVRATSGLEFLVYADELEE